MDRLLPPREIAAAQSQFGLGLASVRVARMPQDRAQAQLAPRLGEDPGKKAVILPANQAVALAGSLLKLSSVDDADFSALALDEAIGLQLGRRFRHTLAPDAQQGRNQLLRAVNLARGQYRRCFL